MKVRIVKAPEGKSTITLPDSFRWIIFHKSVTVSFFLKHRLNHKREYDLPCIIEIDKGDSKDIEKLARAGFYAYEVTTG